MMILVGSGHQSWQFSMVDCAKAGWICVVRDSRLNTGDSRFNGPEKDDLNRIVGIPKQSLEVVSPA